MLEPLSSLLRPRSLDDFVGQTHLVGAGNPLRVFIESGRIPSMIFWGPPGTGKTTIAAIISKTINAEFFHLSGVTSKKEDLTKIVTKAKDNFSKHKPTIVFLDEIHRWNKAQQDTLLPFVEKGIVILIGATTENPSFTVNNALLSRARVFVFKTITPEQISEFFEKNKSRIMEWTTSPLTPLLKGEGNNSQENHSIPSPSGRGLGGGIQDISSDTFSLIGKIANGDLRNAIGILESALLLKQGGILTPEDIPAVFDRPLYYDRDTEEHYNIISAMHKSLRDSDGDAAIYWIGRMLAGGEDPLYIARRMLNFAAEDVGISDPHALVYANSVFEICQKMGMPESELILCNLAYYLARAPRDNSVYMAMLAMKKDIKEYGNLPVPMHIRNAPTRLMKELGYGKGYEYAHNLKNKKSDQEHFPDELKGRKYLKK